jgi:hypothetical protein
MRRYIMKIGTIIKAYDFNTTDKYYTFTTPMLGYAYSDKKERFYVTDGEVVMSPDQSRIVEVA